MTSAAAGKCLPGRTGVRATPSMNCSQCGRTRHRLRAYLPVRGGHGARVSRAEGSARSIALVAGAHGRGAQCAQCAQCADSGRDDSSDTKHGFPLLGVSQESAANLAEIATEGNP
jgi:hypothetical protein